jgi:hypothetical protein
MSSESRVVGGCSSIAVPTVGGLFFFDIIGVVGFMLAVI